MDSEILKKVIEIVADKNDMKVENVLPESRLSADLGVDSLDQVELVMEIEDAFKVKFEDAEMEKILTVQDAVELVEKKMKHE